MTHPILLPVYPSVDIWIASTRWLLQLVLSEHGWANISSSPCFLLDAYPEVGSLADVVVLLLVLGEHPIVFYCGCNILFTFQAAGYKVPIPSHPYHHL